MRFRKYFIFVFIYVIGFIGCSKNTPIVQIPQPAKEKQLIYKTIVPVVKLENIAIVFPSKVIGKYAIDATNSALSYLLYKNNNFNIKIFDLVNEDIDSMKSVFKKISKEGISKVLLLCTYNGAEYLSKIENINQYNIYLPLIHKSVLDLNIDSITYGSIDYSLQFDEILKYSNNNTVNFYDNSDLGMKLNTILNSKDINLIYQKEIDNDNGKYNRFLTRRNKKLLNSSLLINMPIVKSSIILSQINANDISVSKILSTQLNYTPLLLSLTQVEDRRNMLIANSIGKIEQTLEEYNTLLDNDISYNWVNYSTAIGIQYLINKDISNFDSISVDNQQVKYPITLYTTTKYSFKSLN